LQELGIEYQITDQGKIWVPGNIDLHARDLTELPDLSTISIGGTFDCSVNNLASLKGAPYDVGLHFHCYMNKLSTLEGGPGWVGGEFMCSDNRIVSLKDAPVYVGLNFYCDNNRLQSLAGAPHKVANIFNCKNNPLKILEGGPVRFKTLSTDFGDFASGDPIPEHLRWSPENRERIFDETIIAATVLQDPMSVTKPLKLKPAAGVR
jgi:hypothetical protein